VPLFVSPHEQQPEFLLMVLRIFVKRLKINNINVSTLVVNGQDY